MALNLGSALKREAVAQGYNLWITSTTGQAPVIKRYSDSIEIIWNEGQANVMANSILASMAAPKSPDDLNVNIDFMPVIIPIAIKKGIGWLTLYTTLVVVATKVLWKS